MSSIGRSSPAQIAAAANAEFLFWALVIVGLVWVVRELTGRGASG